MDRHVSLVLWQNEKFSNKFLQVLLLEDFSIYCVYGHFITQQSDFWQKLFYILG